MAFTYISGSAVAGVPPAQTSYGGGGAVTPSVVVPPPPEPTFGGLFGGLEQWFYQNVEQPITSYVGEAVAPLGTAIGGLGTEIGLLGTDVAGMATAISGIGDSLGALYLFLQYEVPQIRAGINKIFPGVQILQNALPDIASMGQDVSSLVHDVQVGFAAQEQYINELVNIAPDVTAIAKAIPALQTMAPEITLISQQVPEIVPDLENFWNTVAYPEIQKAFGNLDLTAIEQGITFIETGLTKLGSMVENFGSTIEADLTQLGTELENLPKNVEEYVTKSIDSYATKWFDKWALPIIAIGGLGFYLLFANKDCCSSDKQKSTTKKLIQSGKTVAQVMMA